MNRKANRITSLAVAVSLVLMMIPLTATPAIAEDPGTYNPSDIAVINNIIANNGLLLTTANPADGSYVPEDWQYSVTWSDDDADKRIVSLIVATRGLTGILDVSGLANLEYLNCSFNQLASLNVSGLANLEYLDCSYTQLASLNVSGLVNLLSLYCSANQLTSLDVSGLAKLEFLNCRTNQLASLNVSGLVNLVTVYCYDNQLTSLNVSGLVNLVTLECYTNRLTSLNVTGLVSLKYLICDGNRLASLDVSGLVNLTDFDCSDNQLTELDVSGLDNLVYLYCTYNQLTELDVSGLDNLAHLYCSGNQLTELDVSGLDKLVNLFCPDNQLTELDVSGNDNLAHLYCAYNQLTALDVSGLVSLGSFDCSSNQLTELDVSVLVNLSYLDCHDNKLAELDVSGPENLAYLCCDGNQLTEMDVSGLVNLAQLFCYDNQLEGLNVSGLVNLEILHCNGNQLTELDVSGVVNLQLLHCNDNQLTELDVSGAAYLQTLFCNNNKLTSLDVSNLGNLEWLDCSANDLFELRLAEGEYAYSYIDVRHNYLMDYGSITGPDLPWDDDGTDFYFSPQREPPLYHPGDIEAINNIIENNGLNWTLADPADGSYIPGDWSGVRWAVEEAERRIVELEVIDCNLTGSLDVSGLDQLRTLICSGNRLTALELSEAANYTYLNITRNIIPNPLSVGGSEIEWDGESFIFWPQTPGMYNPGDIEVINNIILDNGHNLTPAIPSDGSYIPDDWYGPFTALGIHWSHDDVDKRIVTLGLQGGPLHGTLNVSGLTQLNTLFCASGELEALANLPDGLEDLTIVNNRLQELPQLPLGLRNLNCPGNELASLDASDLDKLEILICNNNYLEEILLSRDNVSLVMIDVSNNRLTSQEKIIGPEIIWDEFLFVFSPQNVLKVSFDANGGALPVPESMIVPVGRPYGVLANTTRTGYNFAGWFTARTGGTEVRGTTMVSNPADHTLFARWEAIGVIVTFDANGGTTPSFENKTVTYDAQYGALPTTGRNGYTFAGWYTSQTEGARVYETTTVSNPNAHALYARWEENPPPRPPDQPPLSPTDLGPQTIAITSPANDEQAQSTIASGEGYTGAINWYNVTDSRSHTGVFLGGKEYRATVTLTSTAGYQWPARAPAISVVGQTVSNGTVAGVGTGNTLTFEVTFAETNEDDDTLPIVPEDWPDPDAEEYVDEGLVIIEYVGTEIEGQRFITSYADEVFRVGSTETDINADNLVAVYFNRDLLKRSIDYYAEDGSVKITIRAQTFERYGEGDHTIAAVFSINGEEKVAAQKVIVATDIDLGPDILGGFNLFSDVNLGDWFYKYIKWAYENGYMVGVGNSRFAPHTLTSEAMITAVLARLAKADLSQITVDESGDIDPGRWFSLTASWAKTNGLLGDRDFSPDSPITRGELAIVLVKFLDYLEIDYDLPATTIEFADAELMSAEENEAFQILYTLGIFEGVGGNRMVPQGSTNRAQLAALLFRLNDLV